MKNALREKITESKRQLILQEVSKIFESEGIGSVTMQQIAKKIGISVGSLYNLFDSKEALYSAYVNEQIRHFHEEFLRRCPPECDPLESLEVFVRMKFDTFRLKRKAVEDPAAEDPLFFLKMHSRQRAEAEAILTDLARRFEALNRIRPLKEEEFLKLAYLFNAFSTGYVEYWLLRGGSLEVPPAEVVTRFLEGMYR